MGRMTVSGTGRKMRSSVREHPPRVATFKPKPRMVNAAADCSGAFMDGITSAFSMFEVDNLVRWVVAPVARRTRGCHLRQSWVDGWTRSLDRVPDTRLDELYFPPVLVSARGAWHMASNQLELFDRAYILDGAKRLEAAVRASRRKLVPVVVLLGLNPSGELALRRELQMENGESKETALPAEVGTATQRIDIGTRWTSMSLESDPFIVPTARGYAPAVLVRRSGRAPREHLLIGARSLSLPLEAIREEGGTLLGRKVRVRKESVARTSRYLVEEVS